MFRNIYLVVIIVVLFSSPGLSRSDPRTEFEAQLAHVIARLNRQAQVDSEGPALLAGLIQREYGTRVEEISWAVEHSVKWGDIAAFAYIQATTGRRFETLIQEDARRDFWTYVEKADMTSSRMVHSLESFLKLAEKERNSRIFERLRTSRRVQAMPDLGSGFGLFQEALDFRRIDSPRPTKIHTVAGVKAKGDQ